MGEPFAVIQGTRHLVKYVAESPPSTRARFPNGLLEVRRNWRLSAKASCLNQFSMLAVFSFGEQGRRMLDWLRIWRWKWWVWATLAALMPAAYLLSGPPAEYLSGLYAVRIQRVLLPTELRVMSAFDTFYSPADWCRGNSRLYAAVWQWEWNAMDRVVDVTNELTDD